MYFSTKSYLKNTRNHTTKHAHAPRMPPEGPGFKTLCRDEEIPIFKARMMKNEELRMGIKLHALSCISSFQGLVRKTLIDHYTHYNKT
jgi:hypothetical protein